MNTVYPSTHDLLAGQAAHLALAPGDVVMVTRGAVRLRMAPQWVAERMLAVSCRLEEGEHHLIAGPGWVVLEALSGGAGVCIAQRQHAAPVRRAWPLAWLRRLAF